MTSAADCHLPRTRPQQCCPQIGGKGGARNAERNATEKCSEEWCRMQEEEELYKFQNGVAGCDQTDMT